jgi:hypothetical protein
MAKKNKDKKTLINFLVEENELRRFDSLAESLGRTRTSILVEMMRDFCSEQAIVLEQRNNKLKHLDNVLAQHKLLQEEVNNRQNQMFDPPV